MKTKEFIRKIEELEFECVESDGWFYLRDLKFNDNFLAEICINEPFKVDTGSCEFGMLPQTRKIRLFDLIIEYARTPIKDRGDTSKHIYKHNFIKTKGDSFTYLAIRQRPSISYPVLQGSNQDIFEYKVEFTDEEIEEVKKEYGIFLDDFKKLEVEYEN